MSLAEVARRAKVSTATVSRVLNGARLVKNSEEYYRAMFGSHVESWNVRDRHMSETLNALNGFLSKVRGRAKIVVWEHNSHIGDARFTDMGAVRDEINIGQLCRDKFGRGAALHPGRQNARGGHDQACPGRAPLPVSPLGRGHR